MRSGYSSPLAACAAVGVAAPASAQTVKLGIVNTYSGPFAAVGEQLDRGIRLYVKQHEKDLPPGVKLEIIRRDDTGPNPEVAKRMAQELITRDQGAATGRHDLYAERAGDRPAGDRGEGAVRGDERRHRDDHHQVALYRARVVHHVAVELSARRVGGEERHRRRSSPRSVRFGPGIDAEAAFTKGFTDAGGADRRLGAHAAAEPRYRAVHAARQGCQAGRGVHLRPGRQGGHRDDEGVRRSRAEGRPASS